jgi:hypothetical protein
MGDTMSNYTHTLTPTEEACGVTLDDVARELPRGVFRDNGRVFVVAESAGPALAASVARCAFGGAPVEYAGRSLLGRVYVPVQS